MHLESSDLGSDPCFIVALPPPGCSVHIPPQVIDKLVVSVLLVQFLIFVMCVVVGGSVASDASGDAASLFVSRCETRRLLPPLSCSLPALGRLTTSPSPHHLAFSSPLSLHTPPSLFVSSKTVAEVQALAVERCLLASSPSPSLSLPLTPPSHSLSIKLW